MLLATVACTALVLLGMGMLLAGWSGQTPTQRALLDLAQMPIVAAILVGIVSMTWSRRLWRGARWPFQVAFGLAGLLLLAGLVVMVIGYGPGPRRLSLTAMMLIWLGVGIAFLYVAADMVRHPDRPLLVTDVEDWDEDWDDEEWDDAGPDGLAGLLAETDQSQDEPFETAEGDLTADGLTETAEDEPTSEDDGSTTGHLSTAPAGTSGQDGLAEPARDPKDSVQDDPAGDDQGEPADDDQGDPADSDPAGDDQGEPAGSGSD